MDPQRELLNQVGLRVVRLERIVMLLCREAARGQGQMGGQFWDYVDAWRQENRQ